MPLQPSPQSFSITNSVLAKLGIIAVMFALAVAAVHFMSLARLGLVDVSSREIRNRWLDNAELLGGLTDQVSDVRAAEAQLLLSREAGAPAKDMAELQRLLGSIEQVRASYSKVPHDAEETLGFNRFQQAWALHVPDANRLASLVQGGHYDAAAILFAGDAQSSYHKADMMLQQLLDLTAHKAQAARDQAAEVIANAQNWISALIMGILLLFVSLSAFAWWSVSRPLVKLAGQMHRLAAEDTAFTVRFQDWRDEIGGMARALAVFRRNTIELLESRKQLSNQTEALTRALEKERALAAEQKNFVSTISHELRTPLMVIDGNAQRLIATHEHASPSDVSTRAQRIRAAVFRMTNLLTSLMNAIEIAEERLPAPSREFDPRAMLEHLCNYYSEIGLGRRVELRIGDLPDRMIGDPQLLYHGLSNLISNAFKYSPESATVTMSATTFNGSVEIAIEDQGMGIPAAELGRVRERYYRATNVGSVPGTGMGLHLVDKIMHHHGGRLGIESELGKGTRVTVVLPSHGPEHRAECKSAQNLVGGG